MLFPSPTTRAIATTPEIERLLDAGSPVALGVSGGKDSCAAGFALNDFLNARGHTGERVLIHSDLGRVEWKDSLPTSQRLADRIGWELVVVRRGAGDMMDRWLVRWQNNVARYAGMECVKLILPWSTPAMRFCTSELKTDVICRDLVRRFPGQTILSASGIRRQESPRRANSPVTSIQLKLANTKRDTDGFNWNPIPDWSTEDVFAFLAEKNFPVHEAYRVYGSSRVSCSYCIMGSIDDLIASSSCPDNQDIYREMVGLELDSTFGFQSGRWLCDVAPNLLSDSARSRIGPVKANAKVRETAEARIPKHLLYTAGWPTCVPSRIEAILLCSVRSEVADAVGIKVGFTEPDELIGKYEQLIATKKTA
jgi:3'-phosphoadenosine 5'-phosphosulfate sulfotransferase (PAPS reductase)/FAD synthetase